MTTLPYADENRAITMTEVGNMETTDIYKNMKKKFSRLLVGFGAAQITIGFLCLVINGVTLGMRLSDYYSGFTIPGHGILPGFTFITAGALGVAAGLQKKRSLVVASNVLGIISACLCLIMFICSVISASVEGPRRCYNDGHGYSSYNRCDSETDRTLALDAMLAILAFLEVAFAIGSSVVCCSVGACCCDCAGECCCPLIIRQPKYYAQGVNQMTIPPGQQQPMLLINPNQMVAQYKPQQMTAPPQFQNPENSGMTVGNF